MSMNVHVLNIYIYTHIYINKCKKRSFSNCIYVSCIYIYIYMQNLQRTRSGAAHQENLLESTEGLFLHDAPDAFTAALV